MQRLVILLCCCPGATSNDYLDEADTMTVRSTLGAFCPRTFSRPALPSSSFLFTFDRWWSRTIAIIIIIIIILLTPCWVTVLGSIFRPADSSYILYYKLFFCNFNKMMKKHKLKIGEELKKKKNKFPIKLFFWVFFTRQELFENFLLFLWKLWFFFSFYVIHTFVMRLMLGLRSVNDCDISTLLTDNFVRGGCRRTL